ncbi:MAG: sigma-70 family RNA polymerase sigma factor [Clostridiaceae bacterium]|nr:sigma-70 family RNA polymerase sigma factor [Clostridiaceae bacterium]
MSMNDYSIKKIEDLYLKYNKILYTIAYRILNNHQWAQDAVQATFVKIIENIAKIGDVDCNKTKVFIVIICRNISINIYNKHKRSSVLPIEKFDEITPDYSFCLEEELIGLEGLSLLKEKINMLYEPYADIITLRYIFDYSEKEISKILDITEQNVRVRLSRAKKSLMKLLREDKGVDVV